MSSLYSHRPQSSRDGVDLLLMYGQGREDVRVDLNALSIQPSDKVLVISSGGCSALRLLAEGPALMRSIDLNRTQTIFLNSSELQSECLSAQLASNFSGKKTLPRWSDRACWVCSGITCRMMRPLTGKHIPGR